MKKLFAAIVDGYAGGEEECKKEVESNIEVIKELFNLAYLYEEEYKALKSEENGVDFLDLEKYTIKLFENKEIFFIFLSFCYFKSTPRTVFIFTLHSNSCNICFTIWTFSIIFSIFDNFNNLTRIYFLFQKSFNSFLIFYKYYNKK